MAARRCLAHKALLLLLLLLLLSSIGSEAAAAASWPAGHASTNDRDDPESVASAAVRSEDSGGGVDNDRQRHLLLELSELLRQELHRRSAAATAAESPESGGISPRSAAAAAAAVAAPVAAASSRTTEKISVADTTTMFPTLEAVTWNETTGNSTAGAGASNIFVLLWLKLRSLLPLPALIAVLVGAGILILLILILIIYCCCCREKSRNRKEAPVKSIIYKDLDLHGANKAPYGTLNYSMEYDLKKDNLIVTVSNCQDLPKGLDSLDPYVIVSVMSEKDETRGLKRGTKTKTSKTVRNTSHPVFNFACVFPVKKKSELKEKIVVFEVYDWDYSLRHDMVARKVIHLRRMGEGLDDILGRNVDYSKALNKGLPRDARGPGDVCLSLYYAAKDMSLTVKLVECKGVFVSRGKEEPDLETMPNTFVKIALRNAQSSKREQVKRSKLVSGTRNPYFNQQFVFDVGGLEQLEFCVLRVTLIHRTDTLRIKRPVGSLEMGSNAPDESLPLLHWRELLQTPNRASARWHNLITPEDEERNRKTREKEEKRRLLEMEEEMGQ